MFRLRGTRRPPPRPPRSTTLERSLPRSVVDARAGPPAVDQVNASADVEPDQPDDACSIPSQLLTVEMLRRPLESTQYLSIRYTERLAEAGIEPSVGSVGDSYDNALAETIIGLYKTEVIRRCGPWRNLEEVEFATLEWVDWFNNRRLFGPLGNIPPAEFEALYDGTRESQATGVRLN